MFRRRTKKSLESFVRELENSFNVAHLSCIQGRLLFPMPSLKAIAKEVKTKKPAKVKPAKKPSPEFTLSSEFIQESDEDEDEDEASGAEPASNNKSLLRNPSTENPKINGTVKVPLPDSSSSSESPSDKNETSEESSSEESEEEDEPNKRAKKTSAPEREKYYFHQIKRQFANYKWQTNPETVE